MSAYFPQQQLDGLWSVYRVGGVAPEIADIETRGDALNHILDLVERDRREAQIEAAIAECVAGFNALLAEAA